MKKYLSIENVCMSYEGNKGGKKVLEDISFSVFKGEFLALLGPSGCGKTSLLKIIASFLKTERGAVYKEGKRLTGPGPDRIMVFQEFTQLFPWKTVLDNVIFAIRTGGNNKDSSEKKEIAQYYLEKVELSDVLDYYPAQLSGGMKQRAALARALAADPEILLMDEPFGSLDSQTRRKLQDLLINIWQEDQKTILFVTHDLEEALILADRIILMDKNPGRVKRIMENNLKRPRHRRNVEFVQHYETISSL